MEHVGIFIDTSAPDDQAQDCAGWGLKTLWRSCDSETAGITGGCRHYVEYDGVQVGCDRMYDGKHACESFSGVAWIQSSEDLRFDTAQKHIECLVFTERRASVKVSIFTQPLSLPVL